MISGGTRGTLRDVQAHNRLMLNRWEAAGIDARKELIGAGLALVLVALTLLGVAVVL